MQQSMNQAYTIEYVKSTKASHYSKNSSISNKPKEATKRSGTTGGTESNTLTLANNTSAPLNKAVAPNKEQPLTKSPIVDKN